MLLSCHSRVVPVTQSQATVSLLWGEEVGMLHCRCWPLLFTCTQTCSHSSSFVAGKAAPFLSDRRQLSPAQPPFACEIQAPRHLIPTACAHCLSQQGANGRAGCSGAAVLVPGDMQGCVVSLACLGR